MSERDSDLEDAEAERLIARIQAGEHDLFAQLYHRYFERVFGYLRFTVGDFHEAQDLAQQVFLDLRRELPGYELGRRPFRAWLFAVARNRAISHIRKQGRVEIEAPEEIDRRRRQEPDREATSLNALDWITDADLLLLVDRLPIAQRQVIVLRFMLDLEAAEIAEILGRTPKSIHSLKERALAFLSARLTALGREPSRNRQSRSKARFRRQTVLYSRRFGMLDSGPPRW